MGIDPIIGADEARKANVADLMNSLSSSESGLSTSEAEARLQQYGQRCSSGHTLIVSK
ncbi:Uncharacterised protein [uncultured archaeon]|nr:Uncharacterised protein [uncultured archaeon]